MKKTVCEQDHQCPECLGDTLVLNWTKLGYSDYDGGFGVLADCPECGWKGHVAFALEYKATYSDREDEEA